MKIDLRPLLEEPDAKIVVTRHELLKMCIEADDALDGDTSNEQLLINSLMALGSIRNWLSEFLEAPERRLS